MQCRVVAVIGLAAVLGAAIPGSVALAAGTGAGGATKVWVTPNPFTTSIKHPGKVVFTGAIADFGTSVNVTAAGKPTTKKTVYKMLKLSRGSILVDTAGFTQAVTSASPTTVDTTTCSFVLSGTGSVTIVKGTGAYRNVTGSFTVTGIIAAVLKTKGGACTTKGKPAGFYISVQGSGTVSF